MNSTTHYATSYPISSDHLYRPYLSNTEVSLRVQVQSCEHPVVVLTDHKSTRGVVNQSSLRSVDLAKLNTQLMLASTYLSQFSLDIRYIPGRLNLVPDALSRLPTLPSPDDEKEAAKQTENVLDDIIDDFGYTSHHHTPPMPTPGRPTPADAGQYGYSFDIEDGDSAEHSSPLPPDFGYTAETYARMDDAEKEAIVAEYSKDSRLAKIIGELKSRKQTNRSAV